MYYLGLLLEINVEQNEYDGDLTQDAGIRVHIGKPGKVPFPYEKGFSVGPGTSTSVGMRKVVSTCTLLKLLRHTSNPLVPLGNLTAVPI